MLQKTRGIVINYIRYRETSIIAKIYTEEFGIQTYIENGVRSSRSKNKIALFQPLTLLELVVYYRESAGINRISEIKCHYPFQSLPYEFLKSSIAIFITEILNKTLKEETANNDLFKFLLHSILFLDQQDDQFENFPIQFLLKLSRFLGFAPQTADLLMDQIGEVRIHDYTSEEKEALNTLLALEYGQYVSIPSNIRRSVLDYVLKFYALQIETFGEVRSLTVLKEILS